MRSYSKSEDGENRHYLISDENRGIEQHAEDLQGKAPVCRPIEYEEMPSASSPVITPASIARPGGNQIIQPPLIIVNN